ncbi:hypothetical protein Glove_402g31 [Diversispora epigaea]|uniref:Uncharacterized protein n=1 Tax=Diversispora epigaea TaxID=1348612 RepID=A0A397H3B2_9GLOM|nr:hypothetical protein Glove_402g31 [Diversispora epigaea]
MGPGQDLILITEYLDITQDDEQEANLFGAINHFENLSEKVGKVAIIGRGHGGSLALRLIALYKKYMCKLRSRVDCGVVYYPINLKDHIKDFYSSHDSFNWRR